MKRIFILFLLPLLGCATGGTGEVDLLAAPQIRTVMSGSSMANEDGRRNSAIRYVEDPITVEESMDAAQGEVWPLLIEAYRAEGLEPDGADPATGLLNLSRVEWSRTRDGFPLSRYLDCGPSSTGRELADDSRVVASIASQVIAEESGTSRVTFLLQAVAYPFDASSGQIRGCTTKGVLEHDLIGRIQARLDPGPAGIGPLSTGVRANTNPTSLAAPVVLRDLSVDVGDQIRVWISPSIQLTGTYMGIRPDTLLLLRSRRTPLALSSIEGLQVRRTNRFPTAIGALIGVATA